MNNPTWWWQPTARPRRSVICHLSAAKELLKQDLKPMIVKNYGRRAADESGGIIFTTVQKFALLAAETAHPCFKRPPQHVVFR